MFDPQFKLSFHFREHSRFGQGVVQSGEGRNVRPGKGGTKSRGNPGTDPALCSKALGLSGNEGRDGAIQGVGDGAEHFGLGFANKTVGGDGLGASVENVLFDLRGGL